MAQKIRGYPVNIFKDRRGSLRFANEFKFVRIKRFYDVKNSRSSPIRAFHAHMNEEKYIYPVSGKTLLCLVKITKTKNPSKNAKVHKYILSEKKPQIIHVPSGYANGFRSLTKDSRLIIFSTSTLKQSVKDDYRFPPDYWGKDIWKA